MALLATLGLALVGLLAQARGPVVNAHLSTGVARMGSDVSLVVDVEGVQNATLGDLPVVDGLRFGKVGAPSFLYAMNGIGRNATRTVRETFVVPVIPERTGSFTIPPFPVLAGGASVPTPELHLRIVDDLRGEELGYFRIDAPREIVEGQPFTVELVFGYDSALGEITERVNYINLSLPWLDQLPGLLELDAPVSGRGAAWVKGVRLNSQGQTNAERIQPRTENGRTFLLMRIQKRYLATRAGKLEFPTSHLEFGQVDSGFFNFGPAEKQTYFKRVSSFAIDVLQLPEQGRPIDYTGAVGTLAANVQVDRRDVDAGESIKVTVDWTGEGNLEFFEPPDPSRMDAFKGFRLYGTNDRKTSERRVVTYDLSPITPDVQAIPAIPLVVYDPAQKAYVTITTDAIPIRVRALKKASGLAAEASRSEPGVDIQDIQTAPARRRDLPSPGGGTIAGTLFSLPIVWLGLRTAVRRRGDPDAPAARARRAARRLLRRELSAAKTASEQARALRRFLAARTAEPPQAWVGRDAVLWRREAEKPALAEEQARSLRDLLSQLDERAWARGDAPLEPGRIEQAAEALLRGGL
jgi:hypothetical protein